MLQLADTTVTGAPRRGERMATAALQTEIGWIEVSADNDAITHLHWRGVQPARLQSSPLVKEAVKQLGAYFDKRLTQFDLPIVAAMYPATIDTTLPTAYVRNCVELELAKRATSSALSAPNQAAPADTTTIPSTELVTTSKSDAIRTALIEIDDMLPPELHYSGDSILCNGEATPRVLSHSRTACPARARGPADTPSHSRRARWNSRRASWCRRCGGRG